MAKAATVDELLTKKKPAIATVDVILDSEIADEWHRAKDALEKAKQSGSKTEVAEAQERVEELAEAVDEAKRTITLRGIGRPAYNKLVGEHPPTQEQKKKARAEGLGDLLFNEDSFPAALLAASAVSPEFTVEQAQELFGSDTYNAAELDLITMAAIDANRSSKVVSLGKG